MLSERKCNVLSLVIPLYNEEACVQRVYDDIRATMAAAELEFEIVYINDCSTDRTLMLLKQLRAQDERVKIISFSRNFGHQVAVSAGLRYARGDCVAVMDGDGQDPPSVVVRMLELWRQGYHVVYGVRRTRREGRLKQACYLAFYRLLRKMSPLDLPLDAGDFCLMDRRVVREMCRLEEDQPFVRGLRAWVGFSQTGYEYDRPGRAAGKSKYNLYRLFKLAFDGIMSFSNLVLRTAALLGLLISGLSFVYGAYVVVVRMLQSLGWLNGINVPPGWTSLVALFVFMMGLQFIYLGVLGEYVGRVFMQVKQRPLYVVDEAIGFSHES